MTVPPTGAGHLADVERYREVGHRTVAVRAVARTTLVLGQGQQLGPRGARLATMAPATVVHRRSGGSAVQLEPTGTLWVDAWVPAADALWDADVGRASWWVGEWWARTLGALGAPGASGASGAPELAVHRDVFQRTPLSDVVCFAGLGAGEVHQAGRKVVGVSQWRGRQGALFQCVAYQRFDPTLLCRVLFADGGFARIARQMGLVGLTATAAVADRATDVGTLLPGSSGLGSVLEALPEHLPEPSSWEWSAEAGGAASQTMGR